MSLLLPFTLATILTTDPLGYECVPEDRLEAAFALGGKGMRLPQTCIPDPCEETLTDITLAQYSGYRDAALYGDYRKRMSSVCGTPTVWQEKNITDEDLLWAVFDGGSGPIPLPEPLSVAEIALTDPFPTFRGIGDEDPGFRPFGGGGFGGGGGSGSGGGGGGGSGGGGGGKSPGTTDDDFLKPVTPLSEVDPTNEKVPEVPSQVPLPAPFFLLSVAAAALALLGRRRRGTRAS